MPFTATNPATGRVLYTAASLDAAARDLLLARLADEQHAWRFATLSERAVFVAALGDSLRTHRERLAQALTLEMGKPIVAARAEVDKCALLCDQSLALATSALASDVVLDDDTARVVVNYEPLGVILAIMPWNFPYWQALRFAVPALLAGNGVVIKPAPSVPGSGALLAECVAEASAASQAKGMHPAPCAIALIEQDDLDTVIADARIAGVTLTGSDRAGRHVAQTAGAHLKKVVLELGGSDPFIVLPDADVARAATVAVSARTVNSGQSCIAAKRFIVCDAVYQPFVDTFVSGMRALVVGDPSDERTQVGPIATASVRDGLAAQVDDAIAHGADVLLGTSRPATEGFYFPPTVLANVPSAARASREELFGPVATIIRVSDADEAVRVANASPYGLGASVWSENLERASRVASQLDVGMVFINDMVASDPRYPFGGVKQSGLGRELGALGFREFTNQKTVRTLRLPSAPR